MKIILISALLALLIQLCSAQLSLQISPAAMMTRIMGRGQPNRGRGNQDYGTYNGENGVRYEGMRREYIYS
ncbi:unnamed protein product [Lasius platythorax]|uniref:Uncharacterized protein n=1 Tax=Lasius platythorax TaxID=488582 RepID=A0AAV2P6M8_9HYME